MIMIVIKAAVLMTWKQLRADRAQLENELESESEAMVLRLQRQLQALQSQSQPPSEPQGHSAASSSSSAENAALRERLAIAEAAFTQQVHQCAAYRRELVQLRERLGLDVSDLEHASAQPTLSIYDSPDGVTQSTCKSPPFFLFTDVCLGNVHVLDG